MNASRFLSRPLLAVRALVDHPWVDEALARRELGRIRRWARLGRLQGMALAAVLGGPWIVLPGMLAMLGLGEGLVGRRTWPLASLLVALAVVGIAIAFARASQIWWGEKNGGTLETWLLSRQAPDAVVLTAVGAAALLVPALLWPALVLAVLLFETSGAAATPAGLVSLAAAALLGTLAVLLAATMATAIFFLASKLCPPGMTAAGAVAPGALWLFLWLWLERTERGWWGPWEEHPARMLFAFLLLTPPPVLFGLLAGDWWAQEIARRLPGQLDPLPAAAILCVFYLLAVLILLALARRGYRTLWANPELLFSSATPETGHGPPSSERHYWAGFRNPVWTRELRTRLRGREAAELIFFASICIAAAGFLPLLLAAGQLQDPLAVAAVARDVFFWLSLTLVAFLSLLVPGLTAEAFGVERARGTLELLLVTPMRGTEILRGKLLGAVSIVLLLMSPSLPLFGLVVLFRGAEVGQVLQIYLVLVLHLVFCAGFGVTASALHDRLLLAKVQSYLLAFLAACLPGGAFWAAGRIARPTYGTDTGPGGFLLLVGGLLIFSASILVWCWAAAVRRLSYAE